LIYCIEYAERKCHHSQNIKITWRNREKSEARKRRRKIKDKRICNWIRRKSRLFDLL